VKHFSTIVIIAMSSLLFACSQEGPSPEPAAALDDAEGGNVAAEQAVLQIEDGYMRGIIKEISLDSYEGRGPGSRGDVKARKYLAERMAELGLEPAAEDGSWEQTFDLVGVNATQPDEWVFSGHDKSMTLKQWDQFIVGSGVQNERSEFEDAELVFVGYGILWS